MRRKVVLYNPQSVFYTMPLGLLAVGSALDSDRYAVRIGSAGPWVSAEMFRHVERFKFYNRFAGGPDRLLKRPLAQLARWRCRHDFFALPVEKLVIEHLAPSPQLS